MGPVEVPNVPIMATNELAAAATSAVGVVPCRPAAASRQNWSAPVRPPISPHVVVDVVKTMAQPDPPLLLHEPPLDEDARRSRQTIRLFDVQEAEDVYQMLDMVEPADPYVP